MNRSMKENALGEFSFHADYVEASPLRSLSLRCSAMSQCPKSKEIGHERFGS